MADSAHNAYKSQSEEYDPRSTIQSTQTNCCYLDHFWSNFLLTGYLQGSTTTSTFCEIEQIFMQHTYDCAVWGGSQANLYLKTYCGLT